MIQDFADARTKINGVFTAVWLAMGGTIPRVLYDDDENPEPADGTTYARVRIKHIDGFQAAFGTVTQKRYRSVGQVTVSICTPIGDGLTASGPFVKVTQNAFRGASVDGLFFRAVRVREAGGDGSHSKVNVIADFEYDEIV